MDILRVTMNQAEYEKVSAAHLDDRIREYAKGG
jgi:hypothetical protein